MVASAPSGKLVSSKKLSVTTSDRMSSLESDEVMMRRFRVFLGLRYAKDSCRIS